MRRRTAIIIGTCLVAELALASMPASAGSRIQAREVVGRLNQPVAFTFGIAIGRGFRFGGEGWLAYKYGAQATKYINENLATVSAVLAGIVWWTMFSGRRGGERHDDDGPDRPQ